MPSTILNGLLDDISCVFRTLARYASPSAAILSSFETASSQRQSAASVEPDFRVLIQDLVEQTCHIEVAVAVRTNRDISVGINSEIVAYAVLTRAVTDLNPSFVDVRCGWIITKGVTFDL